MTADNELTIEQLKRNMSAMRADFNACGLGPVAALESHPPDRAHVELDETAPMRALLAWAGMLQDGHFGCYKADGYVRLWLRGRPADPTVFDGASDLVVMLPMDPARRRGKASFLREHGGEFTDPVALLNALDSEPECRHDLSWRIDPPNAEGLMKETCGSCEQVIGWSSGPPQV